MEKFSRSIYRNTYLFLLQRIQAVTFTLQLSHQTNNLDLFTWTI